MILLIIISSLFIKDVIQKPIDKICYFQQECYKAKGYVAIDDKHLYIFVMHTADVYSISDVVYSHKKVFYKLDSGWFYLADHHGVMIYRGRRNVTYQFKYISKKKEHELRGI